MEVIISVIAGALGYLAATFWFRPILRYFDLKHALVVDLIVYENAIDPSGMNDFIQDQHEKRVLSLRTHSAEFIACYEDLPHWFKCVLSKRNEDPRNASTNLMGLSNTRDYEAASKRVHKIKSYLNINLPI